jgi:hypothetical protein
VLVSLYASVLSVLATIAWAVLTLVMTFALPRLQRSGVPAREAPTPVGGP